MAQTEMHRGFEIVIEDAPTTQDGQTVSSFTAGGEQLAHQLKIGNRRVDVSETGPGQFSTSHLPYTVYESVMDLAKAVIDHSPDFDTSNS